MPLINFRTDFKSLRYGSDRPGGGNSGQPFMQFPIDDESTPPEFKRLYEANRTSLDFPIRGGAISQLVAGDFGVISSTVDRVRIERFFKSAPRGTSFIEKQKGLQLTNPRTQVPNSLAFAGPALGNAFLPITNVYSEINTLAQVQVMGTGAHFNRHGYVPNIFESPQRTYAYIAGAPQFNTETTNRLAILKATKILTNTQFLPTGNLRGIDPGLIEKMGISQFRDQIYNYIAGPGSVYGIGFTRTFRVTDTSATTLQRNQITGFTVGGSEPNVTYPYAAVALTYDQLASQNTRPGGSAVRAVVQDFREQTNLSTPTSPNTPTPIIPFSRYNIFNIAKSGKNKIGVGNPGAPTSRVRYTETGPINNPGSDQLNLTNPFFYNSNTTDPWTAGQELGAHTKDLIKFAFECLDNNSTDGGNTLALIFRALLEGQISDSNQASYNEFKYLGRGETFRTYQGFDRTIGFSFKMFAQSRQEMLPMYRKLNALISQVYPDYSPEYNLMRGNVVKLTIGDYLYRIPGFLENVNVTIDNSNTPWEIVLGEYEETDVRQLPHMVTVQCTFKPIFDILPRRVDYRNPFIPLIVNGDTYLEETADERRLRQFRQQTPTQLPTAAPVIPVPTASDLRLREFQSQIPGQIPVRSPLLTVPQ